MKDEKKAEIDEQAEAQEIEVSGPMDEVADLTDRLQRLRAEFENYKKRVARDAADRSERASDQFLLDILPLYDGMQLAFENLNRDKDTEAFVAGAERIFAQFEQVLSSKGVTRIEALGQAFDPAIHEALLSLESEQPKNTIIEQFSPGYTRDGRTIRPSKVAVSQGTTPAKEEKE